MRPGRESVEHTTLFKGQRVYNSCKSVKKVREWDVTSKLILMLTPV